MMDIYLGISVGVVVLSMFAILASSMLGIKERSYEEAVAEQREATSELLGISSQSYQKSNKNKEKKLKKTFKGNKKKLNIAENVTGINKIESTTQPKHQAEFKEAEVVPESAIEELKKKVQGKNTNDKVRSILVNRQDTETNDMLAVNKQSVPSVEKKPEEVHHQELNDNLEPLNTNAAKQESKETTQSKSKKPTQKDTEVPHKEGKKTLKQIPKVEVPIDKEIPFVANSKASIVEQQPTIEEIPIVSNNNANHINAPPPVVKEKKRKNNASGDKQLLQQHNGVANMALLFPLVRNAELTRSEVQTFIDMLLNKQLEAPSVLDDWSEGRTDPLQKLKRQLLEREKQLEAEQDAKIGLQQKLLLLREELNTTRIQWIQRTKVLEESVQMQQQVAQRQNQQLQQMQAQINEAHKVRDDYTALQRQHKQIEIRAAQVAEVEEVRTKKLLADAQEMQTVIGQLRMDNCNITEQLRHASEKRQQVLTELNAAGIDLVRKDELIRELEQTRINMEHQHKADFNQMQSHLQQQNEEIRRYEFNNDEMQKQRNDTERLIAQLRAELAQTEEQNMQGALVTIEAHQVEVRNLQNEQSSLRGQLNTAVREHKRIVDELQDELQKQREKNNALRARNWKVVEALNVAETRNKQSETLKADLEANSWSANNAILSRSVVTQTCDDLERSKTTEVQLQNKIERLQEAIVDSETMLRNLYVRLKQEEIDWRSKLNEKDAEINRLSEKTHELHLLNSGLDEGNTLSTDENVDVVNSTGTVKFIQNLQTTCTSTNGSASVLSIVEETNGKN